MLGFFKNKTAKVEERNLADPSEWLLDLFGGTATHSEITVSASTAMKSAPVRCAVTAISEAIGQLPLNIHQVDENGAMTVVSEHPAMKALKRPNPWTDDFGLRQQMTMDALLHGNAYALIVRVRDQVSELHRLRPDSVMVDFDNDGGPRYRLTTNERGDTAGRIIPREDILHLKAPGVEGIYGDSPVTQCREAIGLSLVLEKHAARLFGQGAKPSGVIEIPGKLGQDAVNAMRAAWTSAQSGASNSGKTAILWDGAKFSQLTMNSTDAQFLEMRRFAIDEIARTFRVPPHLLMELGRATWGNAGEMGAQFVRFTLLPWMRRWTGEIENKLLSETDRDNHIAAFEVDELNRGDMAARANSYSQLIAARVMSPNEARAKENMPPYEGGDRFENPNTTTTPSRSIGGAAQLIE